MTALNARERSALRVLIASAAEWAGDHGLVEPRGAIAVYHAIAQLEPLTRQGRTDHAWTHWTRHIDDHGTWIVRDPSCPNCADMLSTP